MNNRNITLAEFRAWLEGVEELQPVKWSPNSTQWKLIRKKLDLIVPDTVIQHIPQYVQNNTPQHTLAAYREVPQNQTALPAPAMPTNLDAVPIEHQSNIGGITARGGRIITPNIDTSDGNFQSRFE